MDMKLRGQQLSDNKELMPMPNFIGRTALYYEDHWFENALFLNLGVSARYFSSYRMRAYHPLLSDFVVQRHLEMEGYPIVNAYFNMKIRNSFKLTKFMWEYNTIHIFLVVHTNFYHLLPLLGHTI